MILKMKSLRSNGVKYKNIAKRFGISVSYAYVIVSEKYKIKWPLENKVYTGEAG